MKWRYVYGRDAILQLGYRRGWKIDLDSDTKYVIAVELYLEVYTL